MRSVQFEGVCWLDYFYLSNTMHTDDFWSLIIDPSADRC